MDRLSIHDLEELFIKSKTGYWKLEMENGMAVRMYADPVMLELMGAPEGITPEALCVFFTKHIHPEDLPNTADFAADMGQGEAEFTYRYLHPAQGEVRVRCCGRKVKEEGSLITFVGYHKTLTDVVRLGSGNRLENQLVRRNRSLQQAQERSADYYGYLLDKAACGIFAYTLPEQEILHMNAEALRIYGFRDLEDARAHVNEIMPKTMYPDSGTMAKLLKLREKDGGVDYECTVTGLGGSQTNVLAHTETITDDLGHRSVLSTFLDISENKTLKNEKSILNALCTDYAFVYLCELRSGSTSRLKQFRELKELGNEENYRILQDYLQGGEKEYDARIRWYYDAFVEKDSAPDFVERLSSRALMDYLKDHRELSYRFRVKANATGMEHFEARVVRLQGTDGFRVVIGFRFIDEILKEEEDQRKRLEQAARDAKKANDAKTNFLRRMSHDIRTPLNGIIGLLNIDLAHFEDAPMVRANHEKMLAAADHLLSLINDVLEMSKLEDGTTVLSHEPIDLTELTRGIVNIVVDRATEAGLQWIYEKGKSRIPYPYIYGSPVHLRQIFLNIYGNCIKYNKPHGSISTVVDTLPEHGHIGTYRWVIRDTGIGMSKEFLEHIFDPFTQERVDARSVYQGTGLGMAIVKSLLQQMGGSISIESEVGVGTTFTIIIPFEIAPAPVEKPKDLPAGSIRGLHLLLVEDNTLNAEIAQVFLRDAGAIVSIAENGMQAVERFAADPPGSYDGILMDVMMPVMDGLTAARTIRSLDREDAKTIPIIAMSANAFQEDVKLSLEAGMNAHLAKPLDMARVTEVVSELCGH